MLFTDRLTLDKPRRSADGYMAIHARAARTGVYQYLGREVDPAGKHFAADQVVNVYRDPAEVFDKASLGSFVGKPITNDHPAEAVTADNWKDLAGGTIMAASRDVADDGDFVGFDLAFMDAALIADVDAGKKELSNGYESELLIEDGVAPDGTEFQARQTNIRGNHVAVVDKGRAGSSCCIGDAKPVATIPSDAVRNLLVDQRTYEDELNRVKNGARDKHPSGDSQVHKLMTIDGLQVDISNADTAEATIRTLLGKVEAADKRATDAEAEVATLTTDKATLDAKVTTLEKKLEDSKITPAELRDAAKRFADVAGKAKALDVDVTDDMDEPAIMRAVVDKALGDAAKDWTAEQVAASFAALTKDTKPAAGEKVKADPLADGLSVGRTITMDAGAAIETARRAKLARQETAYLAN